MVKAHLSEVISDVEQHRQRVIIERRGRPVAVIEPYEADKEMAAQRGWFDRYYGALAEVEDFAPTMREVVRSRREARPRAVDLDS